MVDLPSLVVSLTCNPPSCPFYGLDNFISAANHAQVVVQIWTECLPIGVPYDWSVPQLPMNVLCFVT
jgi:hypothetical protein